MSRARSVPCISTRRFTNDVPAAFVNTICTERRSPLAIKNCSVQVEHRAMNDKAHIGVFVCRCGDKISGGLDLSGLVAQVGELSPVAWVGQSEYWCSPTGLVQLRETIARECLER